MKSFWYQKHSMFLVSDICFSYQKHVSDTRNFSDRSVVV